MEKRRTWVSFSLACSLGVALSLGLLLGGEHLVRLGWPEVDQAEHWLLFMLIAAEGLFLGALLGRMVGYYPGIEGFLVSSVVLVRLLARDGFQLGLDNTVEILLKFEAHFAALYFAALIVFMTRGGGLYYPLFLGLRYLRFKMITGISVIGVALGVAALMVVLSVMSGFEMDLKEKIVGTNAHAILQKRGIDFVEYKTVLEKVRRVKGVEAATPFVYNEVMVTSEYNLAGVFIKGIDPVTSVQVTPVKMEEGRADLLAHPEKIDAYLEEQLNKSIPQYPGVGVVEPVKHKPEEKKTSGDATAGEAEVRAEPDLPVKQAGEGGDLPEYSDAVPAAVPKDDLDAEDVPLPEPLFKGRASSKKRGLQGIFIGKELKKNLQVNVGDRINVVSPLGEELGPTGPVPKARSFRVAGVFYTGMYEYDAKSVYVTLESAQDFFGVGDTVTGIAMRFSNIDRAKQICSNLMSALDGYPYFTRTWYQMNKNLFSALKLEKVGMFIVLIIVILVSAFGIISTLIMLVWEKIKEIAILKSMGATGDGVMKIFMIEGITIGLFGTILGFVAGWLLCIAVQQYGIQLDPEVYYIENLPVNMDPVEFVLIAAIALHISFIATIYPSRRASRLRPVEGLRYD